MRSLESDRIHLDETVAWLARAQDVCNGRGICISYDKFAAWHPDPYPETSGYILPTFLGYADLSGDLDFVDRAIALGKWEIDIQRNDGAVLSSVRNNVVRVFNTGQVILGWCCLFERTQNQEYLDAAVRAGSYLMVVQERNGSWVRDTHCGARTYHARIAWSLLRLAELTGKESFLEAGLRHIGWVLGQQNGQGWFKDCGFDSGPPITHAIGYTIRGLLESQQLVAKNGWETGVSTILDAVVRACRPLMDCIRKYHIRSIPGLLPATFDADWKPGADYSCLTGNAQLAICLMRLEQISGDAACFESASMLIDALKRVQSLRNPSPGIRGGVGGSFPRARGYFSNAFPNWAAKFMADALMMRIKRHVEWWVQA